MAQTAPIRVFLVEDIKLLQDVIADLLRTIGNFMLVKSASTEAEATLWLAENPDGWDFAIVDLVLDEGTGMGVIGRCKRILGSRKLVVFSDYVSPGIHKHCIKLGADAAIAKSNTPEFIEYCAGLAAAR